MSPMLLEVEETDVAKKKGISVQIDEDVVKSARLVSALIDRPMSALISGILRPILAEMEAEELGRRARAAGRPPQPPKGKGGGK